MKNLLLTGRPGCGKTTLIESVLRRYGAIAGGFLTREIRERGVRQGFRIITTEGDAAVLAHVNLGGRVRVGKYGVNVEALETVGVRAVTRAVRERPLVIIDEIGRMEITSGDFRRAVLEALDSRCVVLASIQQHADPFTDPIKQRADVRVFQLATENRSAVREAVDAALDRLLEETGDAAS